MKNPARNILLVALLATTILVPLVATAGVSTVRDVERVLDRAATWMFRILIAVGTVFLVLAAFQYLSAAGNAEKLSQANRMLLYTVIAFALGILARAVVFLVDNLIG